MRSNPSIWFNLCSSPARSDPLRLVFPVPVHDLPQQGYLFHPLRGQRNHFGLDLIRRSRPFRPAPGRDDAECAGVRTTQHHRHVYRDGLAAFVLRKEQIGSERHRTFWIRRRNSVHLREPLFGLSYFLFFDSPWVKYEISGPGSEGGENTSTNGNRLRSLSGSRMPTRQPIRLTTSPGFLFFKGLSELKRPYALSSADWRTTQVFNTITSASSSLPVNS